MQRECGSGPRRYFAVMTRPQTYLNLVYLLLGLAFGIAYFVIIVTMVSMSAGLSVTLIGLPLLVLSMYAWCLLASIERLECNLLLGTRIAARPFGAEHGRPWEWQRIKARLRNGATWRSLFFLLFRFPHGIATFVLAVTAVSVPAWLIAMPVSASLGGGADFGWWKVDTGWKGALFVVPGILLFPLFLRLTNFAAALSGRLTALFLDSSPEAAGSAAVDRVAAAAVSWRGLKLGGATTAARSTQAAQLRVFAVHAALFAGLTSFFVLLNGMTTPGTWWCLWVIWALAMLFGAHLGYLLRGLLGIHLGLFAAINIGLFEINAVYSHTWWFFWPLLGWGVVLAAHWFAAEAVARSAAERAAFVGGTGAVEASSLEADPARHGDGGEVEGGRVGEGPKPRTTPSMPPSITVDIVMRVVTVSGREIELTPKEFDLLALFAQNPGRPFSRAELLDRIWRNDYEVTDRTIDTHVLRLRKKLGDQSEAIQTVWGVGYRFQSPSTAGSRG